MRHRSAHGTSSCRPTADVLRRDPPAALELLTGGFPNETTRVYVRYGCARCRHGVDACGAGAGSGSRAIQIPDSSVERPAEHGKAAHTNHLIRIGPEAVGSAPRGETPSSIASVYSLTNLQASGAGVIVIVDAYHYPTALNDFNVFANQFGLPREVSTDPLNANNQVFQVVYAEWEQAAQQLWLGAGSGARHRVGARHGAERQDRAGRSGQQQFRGFVRGRLCRQHDRQTLKKVSMSWGGSEFSSEVEQRRTLRHRPLAHRGPLCCPAAIQAAPRSSGAFPLTWSLRAARCINRNGVGRVRELKPAGAAVVRSEALTSRGRPIRTSSPDDRRPRCACVSDYSFDAATRAVACRSTTARRAKAPAAGWRSPATSVASPALSGIVQQRRQQHQAAPSELSLLYQGVGNNGLDDQQHELPRHRERDSRQLQRSRPAGI